MLLVLLEKCINNVIDLAKFQGASGASHHPTLMATATQFSYMPFLSYLVSGLTFLVFAPHGPPGLLGLIQKL